MGVSHPNREAFAINNVMQDFKTFFRQQLVEESLRKDIAGFALAISMAMTMGIGLDKIGVLKTQDEIRDALMHAQAQGYNPKNIIQQAQQPQIQQKAQQMAKQDAAKSEQLHKKAVETGEASKQQPKAPSAPVAPKISSDEFHRLAMNYIRENELGEAGIDYHKPYKDHKGKLTIGIGHLVTSKEKATNAFKKRLSEDQVLDLFKKDIKSKLDTAHRLFPKYEEYPLDLRIKLLDGIFRGDVSGSPNTVKLINAGKWEKAANEFLDNKEYKEAVKKGYGTGPRMKKIADAIRSMASKQQPQATNQQPESTKPKMQQETTPFF